MNILFRVDASRQIGTGHVARCLNLASALRRRGAECTFVMRLHDGHLSKLVQSKGYKVLELPTGIFEGSEHDYAAWLGAPWHQDLAQTRDALDRHCRERTFSWLVVDHYAVGHQWQTGMRQRVERILVIDDLANREHDADILLDQNYFRSGQSRYEDLLPHAARVMAGPHYALLARRYRSARPLQPVSPADIRRVLVYYGGVDADNETTRALRVLSEPQFSELEVTVVVGINNPHHQEIVELAGERRSTAVLGQQRDLIDLILTSDIVLGAGGTTNWERCCLGIPGVVTTIAANQVPSTSDLALDGFVVYSGDSSDLSDRRLSCILKQLIDRPEIAAEIARDSWLLVDGWGDERLAEQLESSSPEELRVRDAVAADSRIFFYWTNEPTSSKYSLHRSSLDWHAHSQWFLEHLESDRAWLWVLVTPNELPVGRANITIKDGEAVLGFTIDSDCQDRGWGSRFLDLIAERWKRESTGFRLKAKVMKMNSELRQCFEDSKYFNPASETFDTFEYTLEL